MRGTLARTITITILGTMPSMPIRVLRLMESRARQLTKTGNPPYTPTAPSGDYELDPTSDGYNDGEYQPNFNANINGANPDMGAHEKGRDAMQFGPNAFL